MNDRNISIDVFRYLFALEICLWHYKSFMEYFNHGYLAVEFFFILSGVFIGHTALKLPPPSALDYTIKRITKFYPRVILAVLPLLLVAFAKMYISGTQEVVEEQIKNILNEFLFLSNSGIFQGRLNGTLWYINVLIISGGILYGLLITCYKHSVRIFLPTFVILAYTYILNLYDGSLRGEGLEYPFIYKGLLRGSAAMSIGILLNEFLRQKQKMVAAHVHVVDAAAVFSIIGMVAISMFKPNFDAYALAFSVVIIIDCLTENSLFRRTFNKSWMRKSGEMSLNLYLIHFPICLVCQIGLSRFDMPLACDIIIFFVLVHIAAFIYDKLYCYINSYYLT